MSKPAESADPLVALFQALKLSKAKAVEAAKSPKSAAVLKNLIEENDLIGKLDEKQAGLVAAFASQVAKKDSVGSAESKYVIGKILDGKLKSTDQVTGASIRLSVILCLTCYSCSQIC